MAIFVVLLLFVTNSCMGQDTIGSDSCDASKYTINLFPNAPATIIGLFDLSTPGKDGSGCGLPSRAILPTYEAAKWALTKINDNNYAGVKIGMKVFDTCEQTSLAKRAIMESYPRMYSESRSCSKGSKILLGVLSATSSTVSLGVAALGKMYEIPQISPTSSATKLSDKTLNPYFMRSVPPDTKQIKVIIEVLRKLSWKRIGLVYTDDTYGKDGKEQLIKTAGESGICVHITIAVETHQRDKTVITSIYQQLLATNISGVVYFGQSTPAFELMSLGSTIPGAGSLQWIFSDGVDVSDAMARSSPFANGYVSIAPSSRKSTEFEDYWHLIDVNNPVENPWFKDWYMNTNKCKLPGISYEPFVSMAQCPSLSITEKRKRYRQNQFVSSTIDAIFTYAYALKNALLKKCGSSNSVCSSLQSISAEEFFGTYMKATSFSYGTAEKIPSWTTATVPYITAKKVGYDSNGDIIDASYFIWNNNKEGGNIGLKRVGYLVGEQLTLDLIQLKHYDIKRENALVQLVMSLCPSSGCGFCHSYKVASKFYVRHGTVVINGIFSVHDTKDGSYCTLVKKDGAQLMSAFVYAIRKAANDFTNRIKLGAIGIDDCGSSKVANGLVSSIQNNLIGVKDQSGRIIDPTFIEAYTAAHDSTTTISVAEVLKTFKIPLVGYSATSIELSDKTKYPYFVRTVPNDGYQARAIVETLKKQGWTYIQTLQSNSKYGKSGIDAFIKYAQGEKICVTRAYEFGTDGSCLQLIQKLSLQSNAKVVVVFARLDDFRCLLGAMKTSNMAGKLLIFGSETWATSPDVVKGYEDIAVGSLSVKLKAPPIPNFESYLRSLDVLTENENPFFKDWYEAVFECYLTAEGQIRYTKPCDSTKKITDASGFTQSPYSLYVINAVMTIANATDQTLQYYCGSTYNGICDQYRTALDRKTTMMEFVRKAKFTDETGRPFYFTNDEGVADYEIYNYQPSGYVKVAEYVVNNLKVTGQIQYHGNVPIFSSCPLSSGSLCKICISRYQTEFMYIPGDLLIGAVFNIHRPGPTTYACGDVKEYDGFQLSEVFTFAIDSINSGRAPVKLNGLRIGGIGMDGCSSDFMTSNLVSGVHSGNLKLSTGSVTVSQAAIHGWITYGTETSSRTADILGRLQIGQISPSATTTSLSDVANYPTFYRTVPTDDIQTLAMAKFIRAMGFTCVQAIFTANTYGRSAIIEFRNKMKAQKLCLSSCYELQGSNTDDVISKLTKSTTKIVVVFVDSDEYINSLLKSKMKNANAAKLIFIGSETWGTKKHVIKGAETAAENSFFVKINLPDVSNFTSFISKKLPSDKQTNPWFKKYYEHIFKCVIGKTCGNQAISTWTGYEEDTTVLSTINAVYSFTEAIHLTLKELCGSNYKGVCADFVSASNINDRILQNLDKISFKSIDGKDFNFVNRAASTGYRIFRYKANNYREVATYLRHELVFTEPEVVNISKKVQSDCSPCVECKLAEQPKATEKFMYFPGDVLIGGLFDASVRGLFPFTCGGINPVAGFQLTEAFAFALEQINKGLGIFKDKLKGVKLGGIAMDSCQSAVRAGNLITDFHTGVLTLQKKTEKVEPDKIIGYLSALTSKETEQAGRVLTELKIPMISYGATNPSLSNRKKYPFFLRTVPEDTKLVTGMVDFLLKYNMVAVQVVSTQRYYSASVTKQFTSLAKSRGICIAQQLVFNETQVVTESSALEIANLLLNRPRATVIVVILETELINFLLKAVEKITQKNANDMSNKFFYIGSESWGTSGEVISGVKYGLKNGVTFSLETNNIPEFDLYLQSKKPNTYETNPWFNAYYEYMFNCTIPGNIISYPRLCSSLTQSVVHHSKYNQDQYIMYVINGVYSFALGLHKTLEEKCGKSYDGLCDSYRQNTDSHLDLYKHVKTVNFTDATSKLFYFTPDGESVRGYHLQILRQSPINRFSYSYQNIGFYDGGLMITSTYMPQWKSDCSVPRWCDMCPYIWFRKTRHMQVIKSDINMVGFFNVHYKHKGNHLICGDMDVTYGFQRVLAFFYAVQLVNKNSENHMKFKVGALAINTCSNKDRLHGDYFTYLNKEGLCDRQTYETLIKPSTAITYISMTSPQSVIAGSYLKSVGATYISPTASASTLSNKADFQYFLRTVSPDTLQSEAMASILVKFNWTYFIGVNTNSEYGNDGMDAIWRITNSTNSTLCLGARYKIEQDANIEDAISLMQKLKKHVYARVVVLYTSVENTRIILQAVSKLKLEGRFTWLSGDAWGSKVNVVKDNEEAALGAITVEAASYPVESFLNWTSKLSFQNKQNIPDDWFEEYWQLIHECRMSKSKVRNPKFAKECTLTEKITPNMVKYDAATLHIIIATYMSAKGVSEIPECAAASSFSDCLWKLERSKRNAQIYTKIKNAMWSVLPSDLGSNKFDFTFTNEGYGDIGYAIYNYKRNKYTKKYEYQKIGNWRGQLNIDSGEYTSADGSGNIAASYCPYGVDCGCAGEAGRLNKQVIKAAPGKYDQFDSTLGVVISVLSGIGLIASFFCFMYLVLFYPVRGGSTVLGYKLLIGIMLLFAVNFAFVFNPCPAVCVTRRFCLGIIYAICYAPMAVKVMNTWRVDERTEKGTPSSFERFSSPLGLFCVSLALIIVQVIIAVEWLILEPADMEMIIFEMQYWPRCTPSVFHNEGLVLSMTYVMFLQVLVAIFAGLTWTSQENNNESRWILAATSFGMGSVLVWTIVSTMTPMTYRDSAVAIGNLVAATSILVLVFFRKMHILRKFRKSLNETKKQPSEQAYTPEYANNAYKNEDIDKYSEIPPSSYRG